MNKKEFIEQVKSRCTPELRLFAEGAVNAAGELLSKNGAYQQYDVPKAIEFTGRLAPLLASGKDKGETVGVEVTAQSLLTSDFLADRITSWVELVRKELFGTPQPPLASFKEAEQWLKSQSHWQTHEDINKLGEAFKALYKLNLYQGHPFMVHGIMRSFSYLGADSKPNWVDIREPAPQDWPVPQMREVAKDYEPLNWLENETRIMARATGFTQTSLVHFVLLGTQPILPRYVAVGHGEYQALPSGAVMQPMRIDVEINAKDLTFKELCQIYDDYRCILPLKKSKTLNKGHWEVYQLVKEMGPPPGRGIVVFWESVRQRWNESHKVHKWKQYTTWKGMQKAYNRIIEKLNKEREL